MNTRIVAGVALGLIFLVGSAGTNPLYFAELLGSALGIVLYLRTRARRSRWQLWVASTVGAVVGGSLVGWLTAEGAAAFAFGAALGMAVFAGIPMAASAELILTGRARMRRCPFCIKTIPVEAKVCRYCSRDVEPAEARLGFGYAAISAPCRGPA